MAHKTRLPVLMLNGELDSLVLRPMIAEKNKKPYLFVRATTAEQRFGVSIPFSEFYKIFDWMTECEQAYRERVVFPDSKAEWRR